MEEADNSNLSIEEKRAKLRELLQQKAQQRKAEDTEKTSENESSDNKEDPEHPPSYYKPEQFPEIQNFRKQYDSINKLPYTNPYFKVNESVVRDTTQIGGKEYISFASYNYLGLSGHPRVTQASKDALDTYGSSVSASRIATGERPLHLELENELASFLKVPSALVFVSGHATNVTVIGHLFSSPDLILYDELSHNSIIQGCMLSGARHLSFPHNDPGALRTILQKERDNYRRVLIVIEGVYSMDGDIAPLPAFLELKKEFQTMIMVDEAHSFGVIGETGRGISEYFGVDAREVDIWMGTLSKSLAGCGGYIAGGKDLTDYLKYTAPGFMYSVGISPPNAAASLMALKILGNEPQRVKTLKQNSNLFLQLLSESGLDTGLSSDSAIVPVIIGDSIKSLQVSDYLFKNNINVQPIMFPAVAEDQARLRFFITSDHSEEQLRLTAKTLEKAINLT